MSVVLLSRWDVDNERRVDAQRVCLDVGLRRRDVGLRHRDVGLRRRDIALHHVALAVMRFALGLRTIDGEVVRDDGVGFGQSADGSE